MAIFGSFRALVAALEKLAGFLQDLVVALETIAQAQRELGPAEHRLEKLELSRAMHEAEMQALVLRAEGKYKAAANAEARERTLQKSKVVDDLDPDGDHHEETLGPVHTVNADISEEERLHALHLAVAPNDKAHAVAFKFGGGR